MKRGASYREATDVKTSVAQNISVRGYLSRLVARNRSLAIVHTPWHANVAHCTRDLRNAANRPILVPLRSDALDSRGLCHIPRCSAGGREMGKGIGSRMVTEIISRGVK